VHREERTSNVPELQPNDRVGIQVDHCGVGIRLFVVVTIVSFLDKPFLSLLHNKCSSTLVADGAT
jgi:hypothetical protein